MKTNLEAYWMPFTANRQFKANPRLLASAKDMHYFTPDGRQILDGTAGLWCVNAGHCRPKIVEAIQKQVAHLDYAPPFQMGHPGAFELAERLVKMMSGNFDRVFFGNSGSEAVDTAGEDCDRILSARRRRASVVRASCSRRRAVVVVRTSCSRRRAVVVVRASCSR